jgi:hypothetical protein
VHTDGAKMCTDPDSMALECGCQTHRSSAAGASLAFEYECQTHRSKAASIDTVARACGGQIHGNRGA